MGARCLKRWLKQPLQDINEIQIRLNVVEALLSDSELREHLRDEYLNKIPDLDKLYSKFYKVKSGL